jgi:dihydrofolate synthase/folylpolyglutamate synthase
MASPPDAENHGYAALLGRLFSARRFGVDLGLDRIRAVLAALGDPHRSIPRRVAIAGTNGKGSTAAFLSAIAAAAGIRAGLFTSPHLSRFAERFAIAGEPAPETEIAAAARTCEAAGAGSLTFFEQCTAIAAVLFAGSEVQLGIFEVGLGGRLDSTAALGCELVAITGVSYDHCDVLGHDLASIAAEKAGAVRPGGVAIVGMGGEPDSAELLDAAARRAGAGEVVRVTAADRDALAAELGLGGAHQRDNAALAAVTARRLGIDEPAIAAGLRAARLPGRLEIVAGVPERVLDGAHNPDGARALAAALDAMPPRRVVAVVAAAADKDVAALLAPLAGRFERIVATRFANDRALDPDRLAAAVAAALPGVPVSTAPSIAAALVEAERGAERVVVFGSLYAVGEARGDARDEIELSDPAASRKGI